MPRSEDNKGYFQNLRERQFDGVEILNVFVYLRLELNERGLLTYTDEPRDDLYEAINTAERILRDRLTAQLALREAAAENGIEVAQRVAGPDECDHCFKRADLWHNEATGESLCEDCDQKQDQADAEVRNRTQ